MIGDHYGRAADTATVLLTPTDEILGTHRAHHQAANRCRAAALNNSNSASSCADPMCSMSRDPRREKCTICNTLAPEAVTTVRTYGDTAPP